MKSFTAAGLVLGTPLDGFTEADVVSLWVKWAARQTARRVLVFTLRENMHGEARSAHPSVTVNVLLRRTATALSGRLRGSAAQTICAGRQSKRIESGGRLPASLVAAATGLRLLTPLPSTRSLIDAARIVTAALLAGSHIVADWQCALYFSVRSDTGRISRVSCDSNSFIGRQETLFKQ